MSDLSSRTPKERWQRVDEIFDRVLEAAPEQRAALLAQACGEDLELRREVETLLLADQRADGFLDSPAASPSGDTTSTGAGPRPARARIAAGTVLAGRYRIEEHVGDGGMGAVYRARDLVLESVVAVKVLDPQVLAGPGRMEAFRREVRLARLVTHPNVCRVHDIVEDGAVAFITMEYVQGESLADRLRRPGTLPLDWCLRVLGDVARGLAAAHAAGVIHRDLKPGNVLLKQGSDEAVVADFGVAVEVAGPGEQAVRAGTRGYMAPEQSAGAPPDARSDLFSFGVLAHRVVTGRLPGEEEEAGRELPRALARLVNACLERDPSARPAGANEALRLLETRRAKRRARPVAIAAALIVIITVGGLWWRARPAPGLDPGGVIVAPVDASQLDARQSWVGDAFQHLIVNDLIDAWALEARAPPKAPLAPTAMVRTRVWRDASGRLRASVTPPGSGSAKEIEGGSLRELAEAASRQVVERLVPATARHPTAPELREVGARDPQAWRQFRRARRAARMEYWEQVRLLAGDAVRRDPDFVMAWLELGLTYNSEDQARLPLFDKVVALGDRAQGLSPMSRLGVEFARQSRRGDEAGMARAMEELAALKLEGLDLLYVKSRIAHAAFTRVQSEAGFPLLEWIAEKWPQDAAAPKQLAAYYLGADEPNSPALALRHGRQAVALAPGDVAARANLALALLLSGDEPTARAQLAILATADPEDKQDASTGEQTNRLFELHMALGEREDAAADARRLIAGSPLQHAQGTGALAAVDLSRGDFDDGLAGLAKAADEYERLDMDSLALLTHWDHARLAYSLGRHREVLSVATRIHRLNSHTPGSLGGLVGRRTRALETVARMEAGWLPTNPATIAALRKQVEGLGGERPPRDLEMLICLRLQDWACVVDAYRDLESRTSGTTVLGLMHAAAQALERLGRPEEAVRLYEHLARHPSAWQHPYRRGLAWLRLGILREETGDREGARVAFESLLRLWDLAPRGLPEIREAERRLRALRTAS